MRCIILLLFLYSLPGYGQSKMLLASLQQGDVCATFSNANPQQYTDSNALARDNNTNAVTGLEAFSSTTQASVAETGGCTSFVWELTSTAADSNARGREILTVGNSTGTYQYEFWARGVGTDSGGWRTRGWTGVSVSPEHQFTSTWAKYSGTFTATTANPVPLWYTNRSAAGGAVGSIGDKIQITALTIKEQ